MLKKFLGRGECVVFQIFPWKCLHTQLLKLCPWYSLSFGYSYTIKYKVVQVITRYKNSIITGVAIDFLT